MPTGQLSNEISNWLLNKILASREPSAETDCATGRFVLRYGRAYRWMVSLLLAIAAGFLVMGMMGTVGDLKAFLIVTGIFGIFTLAMLIAFYEMMYVKIGFSRDGLHRSTPIRQDLFIPWSGVAAVTYSESFKWLKLRTEARESICVSIYRDGLGTLAEMACERLEGSAADGIGLIKEKTAL
jgi:hypothetical protein